MRRFLLEMAAFILLVLIIHGMAAFGAWLMGTGKEAALVNVLVAFVALLIIEVYGIKERGE